MTSAITFSHNSVFSLIQSCSLTFVLIVQFVASQRVPEASLARGCRALRGQFPHETFCHQYYNCWDGRATVEQCPGDLLFNQVTSGCDYPEAVNCGGRIRNPAPFISGGRCLKEWGVFPDPLDCTAFYECAHGRAFRKVCNIYTAFDERYLVCVHAHEVECGGRGGIYGTLSPPIYPISSATGPRGAKAAIGSSGIGGIGITGWDRKPQQPGSSQVSYSKGSALGAGGSSSSGASGQAQVASSVSWTGTLPGRAGSMAANEGSLGIGGSGGDIKNIAGRNGGSTILSENTGASVSGSMISGGSISGSGARGGSLPATGAGGQGGGFSAGAGSASGTGQEDASSGGARNGAKSMQGISILGDDGVSGLGGGSRNAPGTGGPGSGLRNAPGSGGAGTGLRNAPGNGAAGSGLRNTVGSGDTSSISGGAISGGALSDSIISGITGIVDKDTPPTDRERQYEKPISQEATFRCPHPRGLYANALDCTRFWLCREYRPSLLKCPTGQLFDLASLTCTTPDKAQCSTLTPRT